MLDSIKQIFDDIFDEYKTNNYTKSNLIDKLPDYLKTDSKLTYLDKLQYLNVVKYCKTLEKNAIYETFINDINIDNPSDINLKVLQNLLDADTPNIRNIQNILDNVTYDTFKDFLRYQKNGEDWQSFYFLIKCFELKFDKNQMIIFTNDFPMDKRIKLEALGIWWLNHIIESNVLLNKHMKGLNHELQAVVECNNLKLSCDMKMDFLIRNLDICFEIDEPKHLKPGEKEKDDIKDALLCSNGIYVFRIRFHAIYPNYLTGNSNLNKIYLNSNYLSDTRRKIINILYMSLLNKKKFREDHIKQLFIETLHLRIVEIDKLVKQTNDIEFIKHANLNKLEINNIIAGFDRSIKTNKNSDFEKLYNLKVKSKTSKTPKNITLEEVMTTFKLDYTNDINNFKTFLNTMTFILPNTSNEDMLFEWKHIVRLIQKYDGKLSIKNQLEIYHSEIENIYDIIIDKQKFFTDRIIKCLPNSFVLFYRHQFDKFDAENKKLKARLDTNENVKEIKRLNNINKSLLFQHSKFLDNHLYFEDVEVVMNYVKNINYIDNVDIISVNTSTQTDTIDDIIENMSSIVISDNSDIEY